MVECLNPFHTKSMFLEFVHPIMGCMVSMKPAHDWMYKFKKNWLLGPLEQPSIKSFSIFPVVMKLFPKVSDTTKMISCMKWVNTHTMSGKTS